MRKLGCKGWLFGAGLIALGALVAYLLVEHGPHASFWPKCHFKRLTGLHCIGCGMTRGSHALLQGDLLLAFRYNPVLMTLAGLGLLALLWELLARCSGKDLPFRPRPRWGLLWAVLSVLLAFWVLRNIPAWPFTLLAPP